MTDNYMLPVGQKDFQRMSLLGSIYMPYNTQFLISNGLQPGMRFADIGCGPGNVTLWFAKEVGPSGLVY